MNIKDKFLELTSKTYPHGHENELIDILPDFLKVDEFGNYYHQIGENPSTMFTSHLDTASSQSQKVNHVIKGNMIYTDGSSILGADDKAGVVIMLNMIEHDIKGLYYFFIGEERGCVGSRKLSNKHYNRPITNINKVVSFDRRGKESIITHQLGTRCCSEEFGNALSSELNSINKNFHYENDPTGIYTDSAQFTEIYSECTNISVGYYNEHSRNEEQDIDHLEQLSQAVLLVNWESLPVKRNPKVKDLEDEFDYGNDYTFTESPKSTQKKEQNDSNTYRSTFFFIDPIYNEKSSVTVHGMTKKIIETDFCQDRIDLELQSIRDLFHNFDVEYKDLKWNGRTLQIQYNETHNSTMYREELSEYITELNYWKTEVNL